MKNYLHAFSALLWLLWPLSTLAAGITLGDTLGGVPGRAWLAVVVLSVVSGLMALLQRMSLAMTLEQQIGGIGEPQSELELAIKTELSRQLRQVELPRGWRIFVTWHMLGAVLMGCLTFLFLSASPINDFLEAVVIALTSYGGARLFDKVSSGFSAKVIAAVNRKGVE